MMTMQDKINELISSIEDADELIRKFSSIEISEVKHSPFIKGTQNYLITQLKQEIEDNGKELEKLTKTIKMRLFRVEYDLLPISTNNTDIKHIWEYFDTKEEAVFFIKDSELLGEDSQAINVELYWLNRKIKIDDDKYIEFDE